jgi:hypothetical protein
VALRGICSSYFENHVSPVLRYVSQAQEHINIQLKDIQSALAEKARTSEVLTLAEFNKFKEKELLDSKGVSTLARLQDLSATMASKADAKAVPTREQLSQLDSTFQRKFSQLSNSLERKVAELTLSMEHLQASRAGDAGPAGASAAATTVGTSQAQQETAASPQVSEVKKMQVVIAAAGARFDKQLREVRQQMRELREEVLEGMNAIGGQTPTSPADGDEGSVGERWPGRVIDDSTRPPSEVYSEIGSQAPSLATTVAGLSHEERMELKRIQAVVGAAGTAFSKELKEVRKQVAEHREAIHRLEQRVTPG